MLLLAMIDTGSAGAQSLEGLLLSAPCYVRTVRPVMMTSGRQIPAGVDIGVARDADGFWIPAEASALPRVAKADTGRPDCATFSPPIEARIARNTAVYQRVFALGRGVSSVATRVEPGQQGFVIPPGEPLRIHRRDGDYFVVDTSVERGVMVPVAAVAVAAEALRTGQPVVLPAGASTAASTPTERPTATATPIDGMLYGRLTIPVRVGNRVLDVGSYVAIHYDDGDRWVLLTGLANGAPRIAKAAVEVVPKTAYITPLIGRIARPTRAFSIIPDLDRDPTHLDQTGPMAQTLRVGQELRITAREGDAYVVVPIVPGPAPAMRLPVAAVEIISGDPNQGLPFRVPPLPH